MLDHEQWMELALREADKAFEKKEVPVGAIIVQDNQVIGRGYNLIETLQDPTAHAEMIAITAAANYNGSWRLDETAMYVTLEPCPMCAGAIMLSRIPLVVYGASDPRFGACGSVVNLLAEERFHTRHQIIRGVLSDRCQSILVSFFQNIRSNS
ncbi:nucleoside deaminase [candidate division KSB1 bacterium]|nr:nucleoside deaminase [candidate division KSB1 bacterium]